jgi:hypothetical protein
MMGQFTLRADHKKTRTNQVLKPPIVRSILDKERGTPQKNI